MLVSKPKDKHNTGKQKSSFADDSIKTAPDGRFIIVDEPSMQLQTESG